MTCLTMWMRLSAWDVAQRLLSLPRRDEWAVSDSCNEQDYLDGLTGIHEANCLQESTFRAVGTSCNNSYIIIYLRLWYQFRSTLYKCYTSYITQALISLLNISCSLAWWKSPNKLNSEMSVFINPLSYLHNGLFISPFRQDFEKLVFRNSPKQQIVNVITAMSRVIKTVKTGDGVIQRI